MTKYCLKVTQVGEQNNFNESVALFADSVPYSAMFRCAETCFYDINDVVDVRCIDLDTGEVIFELNADDCLYASHEQKIDER